MPHSDGYDHIADAIFAARRLVLEYKRKNNGLISPIQITAMQTPSGWGENKKIIGMLDVAMALTRVEIEVVEFSPLPEENPVDAFISSVSSGKKVVFVADHNNFCWRRFYSCKELCHAVMNDRESLRTSGAEACRRLISDLKSPPLPAGELYPAYEAECAAYLGAIEMLLPPEFFTSIKESKGVFSAYDIALKYRVPRFVVEQIITGSLLIKLIERIREQPQYRNLQFN